MKNVFPSYYQKFKCIANLCPDSCCKDWDVVVDEDSEAFYRSVQGELGDKLRRLTVTDADGDRIFVSQNGRCPFWNSDMLCDIYIGLGEEHLCDTCKSFPRISQDYTAFCEHILSFACPEAARLILEADNAYDVFCGDYDLSEVDYNADAMRFLLKARQKTAALLSDRELPFTDRLKNVMAFNAQVQAVLNGDEPAPLDIKYQASDCSFIFGLHTRLEIMDDSWKRLLEDVKKSCDRLPLPKDCDEYFERLALYYVYRYYLNAIDSGDVLSTVKRIACAWLVIGKIQSYMEGGKRELVKTMQRYAKEVEHSYENSEELEFEFAANPQFSTESLIALL